MGLALLTWLAACRPPAPTPLFPTVTGQPVPSRTAARSTATFTAPVPSLTPTGRPLAPSATPRLAPTRRFTPTPAACQETAGRIVTGELDTDLLRLPLQYRVYLPPCYPADPDRRYPTLYLFHGQSSTDDQWDRLGVDETADRLIAAGAIPPLLIVMPHDRYGGQPTDTQFSEAIVEELIPYIDAHYATQPNRVHRAVGGLSRGAGWAIHFATAHWKLFGALGAHSPAVFHTDAPRLRTWLDQIPAGQAPRAYIDLGDKDRPEITRSALWFAALLDEYDLPHEWHLFSGYHNEDYWSAHLDAYLRWYTAEWRGAAP